MKFYHISNHSMAPIYIKGGVWTNVEDEILKAAVQKYGLNQWSRVASLLTKKSAKQAKARWNEWINPTINKSDWSREEDEKLLNLAKILPNQWRSIAPIMGRTATHCVDRYQKLLEDNEESGDEEEDEDIKFSGPGIESLPASGNTHVGDLNINPESKPARPDDEDLEDADREMLFEARARLANTKGKKAKRREREKMLEETKRISLLQKRRELKTAGVHSSLVSKNKKKSKEFDYNADIPFELAPPPGIYDTADEDQQSEIIKKKFEAEVSHNGLKVPEKSQKKRERKKSPVKQIEAKAEVDEPPTKRSKLELPGVESDVNRGEYATTELSGVFDKPQEKQPDIDERILSATKDIKSQQAQKSSLLLGSQQVTVSGENKRNEINPKQRSKMIRKLLTEELAKLPPPKKVDTLPIFSGEIASLGGEEENIKIQKSKPNEVDSKVETQQGVEFVSQVVKKGLEIPHPRRLKDISELKMSEVDKEIATEFQHLINSDYQKHVDPTHKPVSPSHAPDPQFVREAQNLIQQQISPTSSLHSKVSTDYQLPQDPYTIQEAKKLIGQLKIQAAGLQETLYDRGNYEDPQPVISRINDLNELYNKATIEHNVFTQIYHNEEKIIEARTNRLNKLVDSIVAEEQKLARMK